MIKVDMAERRSSASWPIDMRPSGRTTASSGYAQPQDIRLSSDGTVFFVADLQSDGVYLIDGDSFTQVGFMPAGVGTHSLYPSRDGTKHVRDQPRHRHRRRAARTARASVACSTPHTRTDRSPTGRSPAAAAPTWATSPPTAPSSGSAAATTARCTCSTWSTAACSPRIPVGTNPHGLTVWPQPGRYSLGHTGNMR